MKRHSAQTLSAFQDAFALALLDDRTDVAADRCEAVCQPGFAVYRNGVTKHAIDALQANFPVVARLVGQEWFRAAALSYFRTAPPCAPMLLEYGAGFADFLRSFEPAAAIRYIADAASLDRMWTEAHMGADDPVLEPADMACVTADALTNSTLTLRQCTRWRWFDAAPAFTIWAANRSLADSLPDLAWHGEGALIVRPPDCVEWQPLSKGGCAFLDACAAGEPIARAARAAVCTDPATDLEQLMYTLLRAGAFSAVSPR